MINQYLDKNGLTYFWTKIKNYVDTNTGYTLPIASSSTLGGIRIGNGLDVSGNGTVSVNVSELNIPNQYVLPVATASVLGGIKIGQGLQITPDGVVSVNTSSLPLPDEYELPVATSSRLGGVKIGQGINVTGDGVISVNTSDLPLPDDYVLPIATGSQLGGIKVGYTESTSGTTKNVPVKVDGSGNAYCSINTSGFGDTVSVSNLLGTGIRIATLTINGTPYTLNAPAGEGPVQAGDTVTLSNRLEAGTRIVTMNISGTTYDIYAPNSGGSIVEVKNNSGGGTRIATIVIDGVEHNIYQQRADGNFISKSGDSGMTGDYTYSTSTNIYAGAFYENSDINVKENIENIKDIEKAKDIDFVQFNFKDDVDKRTRYGVIAQDLESIGLDNLVNENADGIKSVDYISLLCLKIAELEQRINELENK